MGIAGYSPALAIRRAHLSCEGTSPFAQIDHRQHHEGTVGILGQAAIPDLGESSNALERQEVPRQSFLLQQVVKIEQRGGIGNPLATQIDFAEIAKHRNVIEDILTGFIGQVEPVGNQVPAQHPFYPNRGAAIARLGVMRVNQYAKRCSWHQGVHTDQKFRLACGSTLNLESFRRRRCHLLHS